MRLLVAKFQSSVWDTGQEFNNEKTKYINEKTLNQQNGQFHNFVLISGQNYEKVDYFKHFGNLNTPQTNIENDIKDKIASGNRTLQALDKILSRRYISKEIKIEMYKTSHTLWTLIKNIETILITCEMKILRKIYGTERPVKITRYCSRN